MEAPRIWTEGTTLDVEEGFPLTVIEQLRKRGHVVNPMPNIAGGMNGIQFAADGTLTGAACWRADGAPVAIAGGLARPRVRFLPDGTRV